MKRQSFNDGWKFGRAGEEKHPVFLPHDAMQEEKRDAEAAGGSACAFFPGAVYEYEKVLHLPEDWEGHSILLQFEGVYQKSRVYVNDVKAGGCVYGYVPFFVELSPYLKFGEDNVIRVVADNSGQPNSRWYTGGGIYRSVWLWTGPKEAIAPEGVKITTLSVQEPSVRVETKLLGETWSRRPEGAQDQMPEGAQPDGDLSAEVDGDLSVEVVISRDGKKVAESGGRDVTLLIPQAKLWSAEEPNLYQCSVFLKRGETVIDEAEEIFGIREISYDSKNGLRINGKETLLRGGCVHHDNGVLGAASFAQSEWRRVKRMKEAGYNAIRSSHNPASPQMLRACDALGMYVMDETWDMWYKHKSARDYAAEFMDHYKEDMAAMVSRDYNHPSVILYSIGNEVSEPAQERGVELAKEMVAFLHEMDSSRPVTGGLNLMIISRSAGGKDIYKEEGGRDDSSEKKMQGMNSTMFNMITSMVGTGMNKGANGKKADAITSPVLDALDIAGYNYASGRYPLEAKAHPDRVIFGSETFPQDIAKNWAMVKEYPYLIGDFMWTAWDYLGETGIGTWAYTPDGKGFEKPYPWLLADVGAMDILGDPNGELFLAQAAWDLLARPAICAQPLNHPGVKPAKGTWRGTNALPSWNWKGCEGNKTVVEVYTAAAVVELYLNGKRLGKKKVKGCKASFKVTYAPGELKAVAYDASGRKLNEGVLMSDTGERKLTLTREPSAVAEPFVCQEEVKYPATGNPAEVVYVDVAVTGADGIVESNDDRNLTCQVEDGLLLAFGSANPRTEQRYQTGSYATYYGKAQAVILVERGKTAKVTVAGEGMSAELLVQG